MIRNYLKVYLRNLLKNPLYSFINIVGLSVGVACSIAAFLIIEKETSYDKFHDDYEHIYRIGSGLIGDGMKDSMPVTLFEVAPAIMHEVPEIQSATRMLRWFDRSQISYNEQVYTDVQFLVTDSAFTDVFTFPIIEGNPNDFLFYPNKIAITQSLAKKVFGKESAMGKELEYDGKNFEVAWIMADPPENSIIQFEMLANFNFKPSLKDQMRLDIYTFFKLNQYLSPSIETKIKAASNKVIMEAFSRWANEALSPIQAFADIYLNSNLQWEVGKTGNKRSLFIFGTIALIILVIAIVNYINLLTSRSEYRGKEVGLRKVIGAKRNTLSFQFISESVLTTLIALFFGLVLGEALIQLMNKTLQFNISIFEQFSLTYYLVTLLLTVLIGIIAGFYPSFVLIRFEPIQVINGVFQSVGKSDFLKVLLVIIQFSLATTLIIGILVFNSQIKFLKNKQLGFEPKNLMVIQDCSDELLKNWENIQQELINHSKIIEVTASQSIPGWGRSGQSIRKATDDPKKTHAIEENRVQLNYLETIGAELKYGRTFQEGFNDKESIIINEAAAKILGVENPVGMRVITNRESVIIGVVKDYHYYSTRKEITPLYLSHYVDWFYNIVIRINPEDLPNTIEFVKETMHKHDPDYYWSYIFVDDMFAKMYRGEENIFKMIFSGTSIALLLSILGLFALTSYTIVKKFKEVGIRKTLGASAQSIVNQLNKKILRWVLLTNIIAWPAAYFLMNKWLQNYPYHVELNWWHFVLASVISLVIATLTISSQAIRAAKLNPADAIRYE